MNNQITKALKLTWDEVSYHVGNIVSKQLNKEIVCKAAMEDNGYWNVVAINTTFSIEELKVLLRYIDAEHSVNRESLPPNTDYSTSLGMSLSESLLSISLKTAWEHTSICIDGLWLVGLDDVVNITEQENDLLYIDGSMVDITKLMDKDTLLQKLEDSEGMCSDLSNICAKNVTMFGNELYWHCPLPDSDHSGYYFVLVKEGVLTIPYNYIFDLNEELAEGDASLCTWHEMIDFQRNWNEYADYTAHTLDTLANYLRKRGARS